MNKQKIIGTITILMALPGLGGFWLLTHLNQFPINATFIVINAIVFRGLAGVIGGVLIWRGNKWGYYLTLITWIYLILVSFLTLNQLYYDGLDISYSFLSENYSTHGRPFLHSLIKIVLGIPIVHIILRNLLKRHQTGKV